MNDVANKFLPVLTVKNDVISDCNETLLQLLNFTHADIVGTPLKAILTPLKAEKNKREQQPQGVDDSIASEMVRIKNSYHYELLAKVHYQYDESDKRCVKLFFQILKNKSIDPITDLPNGWAIFSQATHLLATPERAQDHFVVIILSVDNFSTINFRYGYDIGDDYLAAFAKKLSTLAKEYGLVVRFSNAKFGILVNNPNTLSDQALRFHAITLCEKICHNFDSPLQLNSGHHICKFLSIGVSQESSAYEDFHAMEVAAETAMLEAQKYSISKCHVATAQTTGDFLSRKLIIDELPHAIETNQINIHYQPQYDLGNGELVGFEALSRWRHSILGNIPPATFIAIAEDIALHFEFDLWVFRQVCLQIVTWQQQAIATPRIAINVSFKTLEKTTFISRIGDILETTYCPTNLIELEITETASAKNLATLHDNILQIKALGIHVAVDDFGAGFSSLSLIRTFHHSLDKLKIDRSLIENICNTSIDREFTQKIIELSNVLNVKILAEGVENFEQYSLLKKLGCDYAQGYYFDKALLKEEAEQLISLQRC